MTQTITFDDFMNIDSTVGRIVTAEAFPDADGGLWLVGEARDLPLGGRLF
jgi:tRNA-binding EMAP/Myf-like protein